MGFPENLKAIREDRGLSQRKLAHKINTSDSIIVGYEHGRYSPSEAIYERLLKALNTTKEELGIPNRKPLGRTPSIKNDTNNEEIIKVKTCFNRRCYLNCDCFCQSPIIIKGIDDCANQSIISEEPRSKDKMMKIFRNNKRY